MTGTHDDGRGLGGGCAVCPCMGDTRSSEEVLCVCYKRWLYGHTMMDVDWVEAARAVCMYVCPCMGDTRSGLVR
jgi:hypothetical protein